MKPAYRYFAKEDPWQDDDDGKHGRPVILARLGNRPGTEAIWNAIRAAWEPFPELWLRLIGGDWWDRIDERRARGYFPPEAFAGGEILEAFPEAEKDLLRQAYQARLHHEPRPEAHTGPKPRPRR